MNVQALLALVARGRTTLRRTECSRRAWERTQAHPNFGGDHLCVYVTNAQGRPATYIVYSDARCLAGEEKVLPIDAAIGQIVLWLLARHPNEIDASPEWAAALFGDMDHVPTTPLAHAEG